MADINPKDVAITVAIVAGLFVGYKVVKGLGSAGDAVGGVVSAVGDGAEAVGDAIAGGWNWVTGFFSSDPEVSVFDDAAMQRIGTGVYTGNTNPNTYADSAPKVSQGGGGLTMDSIGGGWLLGSNGTSGGSFNSARDILARGYY